MLKYSFTKVSGCKFGGQFFTFNYDVDLSLKNEGVEENFLEKKASAKLVVSLVAVNFRVPFYMMV